MHCMDYVKPHEKFSRTLRYKIWRFKERALIRQINQTRRLAVKEIKSLLDRGIKIEEIYDYK